MGTKRPSCTLFDTTPNINTSDRKLQPGGKISRDPSPRPAMTAQSERERDSKREDEWRRERETEKMRDKARYRDIDPRERYYDRDRGPLPRLREGEREPREREMTREGDRSRNGRPLSNVEAEMEGKPERGMKKGDTFPRMTKISAESFKKKVDEERGYRTQRDQLRRMEKDDWERERERARQREGNRERERDDLRRRAKEEGKTFWGDEKVRHRERYQEVGYQERRRENDFDVSHDRRERDTARKREKQRLNTVGTVEHRRRDREMYCDRKERERTHRRVGGRDTRSEGDSDEREMKRERERGREREELIYQHSKSEGDNTGNTSRGKHRQEYREEDRHRETDRSRRGGEKEREGYRETDRREAREGDRWKEDVRDRREYDRYREYDQRKVRERRERDVTTGRGPQNEVTPRVPPRVQSSGEWSSDMDNETRYTRSRDSYEESGKESTAESERDVEDKRSPDRERRRREQKRSERQERTGNVPEQRRMWLEPQRGKSSKESSLEEEFVDKERHGKWKEKRGEQECSTESEGRRVKEDEKFSEQSSYRHTEGLIHGGRSEYKERETEGVSVDGEDVDEVWRDTCENEDLSGSDEVIEGGWRCDEENVTDNTEESDGEEEGGSDYRVHSESEGGSERQERDRMLSGEDGFVTVSSGGDEEDEREEFVDCQDSWEGGNGPSTGFKGGEGGEEMDEEWKTVNEEDERSDKKPTYVFCVIGQTLPRSKTSGMSPSEVGQTGGTGRDTGTNDVTQQPQDDLHLTRGRNDSVMNQDNEVARDRFKVPLEERLACGEPLKVDIRYRSSDTETGDRQRKAEHPYAEIGPFKRDSQTEKLLMEWREKNNELAEREQHSPLPMNPYGDVCSQVDLDQILPTLDGITLEAMSPEEKEAIRIRMSGAWSMSEEPKRHSQAPHLKWAKNVVREILGNSEEQSLDEPSSEVNHSETVSNNDKVEDVAQETGGGQLYKSRSDDQYSEPELEEEEPLEVEGLREDDEDRSNSWGEVELRNVLDTIGRRKRNSKFFNAAQLYQQYSEAAQNFEILRQARSDIISVCEENTPSPAPSPPPARRPLPPLPPVPHPHSLSHTGSITSVKSLPVPEPPKSEGRPSSPRLSISLTQSSTLWRELPAVRNSTELEELTEDQRRLQEVRFEVLTSEASYCRSLDIVVEHFVKSKQLGALLATQDRNWLFSRLADVRAISHSFLSKLEERLESNIMHFTVCDIIARHCQRFKMVYVPYLTNQSYQDATYQRLMNENQGFKRIVEKLERSPVCQRLPLRSFLVLPFQRITRIKLLVQNIVKRTTPGTTEELQAIKALKLLEKLIQESNDSISQMKSIESLVSLSAKVDFECRTLPLISQSRRLVREGPVTELMDFSLKDTERNIYMHLFNDYLLLSQQKEGGRFTVIDHAPVSELRAENCRVKLHSLQKNLFRLHMAHKSLLLRTDTQSDKLRWISALSRPHPEIDFSSAQDFPQMQCIRAFVAQQPDELSLEKADIILVHQQSSDRWVEGTRLSDRHRGWVPESHLELISNSRVRQRNLSDALKLTTATAAV
ncbi:uncharacterized protein arhgef5 isoform 2-T3 [Aulostomus maculatus]